MVEIWPYAERSSGIAWFQLFGRLAGFFTTFVNPIGLRDVGWRYLISYCAWLAYEVVFVYFMFPETFGRTLEELAFSMFFLIHCLRTCANRLSVRGQAACRRGRCGSRKGRRTPRRRRRGARQHRKAQRRDQGNGCLKHGHAPMENGGIEGWVRANVYPIVQSHSRNLVLAILLMAPMFFTVTLC
jgi:hypothetical protein